MPILMMHSVGTEASACCNVYSQIHGIIYIIATLSSMAQLQQTVSYSVQQDIGCVSTVSEITELGQAAP